MRWNQAEVKDRSLVHQQLEESPSGPGTGHDEEGSPQIQGVPLGIPGCQHSGGGREKGIVPGKELYLRQGVPLAPKGCLFYLPAPAVGRAGGRTPSQN